MNTPFTLSIETEPGKSHMHGFHLGTDEHLARQIIEEKFLAHIKNNLPVITMALCRKAKIVDVFDGQWFNQIYKGWND